MCAFALPLSPHVHACNAMECACGKTFIPIPILGRHSYWYHYWYMADYQANTNTDTDTDTNTDTDTDTNKRLRFIMIKYWYYNTVTTIQIPIPFMQMPILADDYTDININTTILIPILVSVWYQYWYMVSVEQNGHAQFWCFKTLCARAHMQVPCYGVRARVSCRSVAPLLLAVQLNWRVGNFPMCREIEIFKPREFPYV